ncbi:hypothetical protein L9F63_005269 [Diploptera punctata]|uniref:Uncharacterized protein n=1 Tax=Diploptera punctata TaxID=6984 RepID=A0AAD7ZD86_DIPPU|nr:hypothetical protein L9F63_005269 [Diploptera punctata]
MAKEKYLTEEELVNILYNDDSGDELIPELEDSQSKSEDELPLPEIDTPISCVVSDVNHTSYFTIKSY